MLSKNLEYTGQRWYLSNIALPTRSRAAFGHGVGQREPLAFERDVAQALVRRAVFVGRFGGAGEPALVDTAAMRAERVPVARRQLDPLAGMQKAARHPGGRKPQQSAAGVEGAREGLLHVVLLENRRCCHDVSRTLQVDSGSTARRSSQGANRKIDGRHVDRFGPSGSPCFIRCGGHWQATAQTGLPCKFRGCWQSSRGCRTLHSRTQTDNPGGDSGMGKKTFLLTDAENGVYKADFKESLARQVLSGAAHAARRRPRRGRRDRGRQRRAAFQRGSHARHGPVESLAGRSGNRLEFAGQGPRASVCSCPSAIPADWVGSKALTSCCAAAG